MTCLGRGKHVILGSNFPGADLRLIICGFLLFYVVVFFSSLSGDSKRLNRYNFLCNVFYTRKF